MVVVAALASVVVVGLLVVPLVVVVVVLVVALALVVVDLVVARMVVLGAGPLLVVLVVVAPVAMVVLAVALAADPRPAARLRRCARPALRQLCPQQWRGARDLVVRMARRVARWRMGQPASR